MRIVSVRENPERLLQVIAYFQRAWPFEQMKRVYEDCISRSIETQSPLPQWYLLEDAGEIVGCAGLITNDFISRMDLWPWLCALHIEPAHRGRGLGRILIERCKRDAARLGFANLYLCTDHTGYYEKYGFEYIADGYDPFGGSSRIYAARL